MAKLTNALLIMVASVTLVGTAFGDTMTFKDLPGQPEFPGGPLTYQEGNIIAMGLDLMALEPGTMHFDPCGFWDYNNCRVVFTVESGKFNAVSFDLVFPTAEYAAVWTGFDSSGRVIATFTVLDHDGVGTFLFPESFRQITSLRIQSLPGPNWDRNSAEFNIDNLVMSVPEPATLLLLGLALPVLLAPRRSVTWRGAAANPLALTNRGGRRAQGIFDSDPRLQFPRL